MRYFQNAFQRLRKKAGLAHFRSQDLMRTAASVMTERGMPRLVVAKVLKHRSADQSVTAVYDRHDYRREKQDALRRWGLRLEEIVSGRAEAPLAEVVPIRASSQALMLPQ